MSDGLVVQEEDPRGEAAAALMQALAAEERQIYRDLGPNIYDTFKPEEAMGDRGTFVVARLDGRPIGCGALRHFDGHSAEINRMYVAPGMRRRGIGETILRELERRAAAFGYRIIRLETGNRQREALSLYKAFGFKQVPPFGSHAADPVSVFFQKDVASD